MFLIYAQYWLGKKAPEKSVISIAEEGEKGAVTCYWFKEIGGFLSGEAV